MSRKIKLWIACILTDLGLYLIGVFAKWDFNPANWEADGRICLASFIFLFTMGFVATIYKWD